MAIADRVVIRADDLLSWCDETINWSYGVCANDVLKSGAEKAVNGCKSTASTIQTVEAAAIKVALATDVDANQIMNSNIRSLKNSKLDFSDVDNEKG